MDSRASSTDRGRDYLEHYGVKGMKWGVRRTRNQLARAAGKKKADFKAKRDPSTPEGQVRAARKAALKNRRTIPDGEIDSFISRLEKEKKLKNLVKEDLSPGRKAAEAIMSDSGKRVATTVAAGAMTAIVAKKFGDTVARGKLKK